MDKNGILIFLAFVVISGTIAAVTRWLRNQQQEEQARLARERSGTRAARPEGGGDTIDRYVAEIERLRQRKAGNAPAPAPAQRAPTPPVVKPVRKARVAEAAPVVKAAAKSRVSDAPRVEDLPSAPILSRRDDMVIIATPGESLFPQASAGEVTARPEVSKAKLTDVPPFLALLSSPKGLATAMAISIVLGPPRCKGHHV